MLFGFSLVCARAIKLVQLDTFIGFLSRAGLPPHRLMYCSFAGCVLREPPILAGGIGVARVVVGAFLFLFVCLEQL